MRPAAFLIYVGRSVIKKAAAGCRPTDGTLKKYPDLSAI
jgi:hypothetical protein